MGRSMRNDLIMLLGLGLVGTGTIALGQDFAPKPTPEHELLAKGAGVWDATIKSWMQGPDAELTVSKGVETVKMMPGGLWALSEFQGKLGDAEFHGAGQSGYDPAKKKFVGTWVDSLSPSVMTMEGEYDAGSKTLTMHSKGVGPDGKPYDAKLVDVHTDAAHRVFTMFMKSEETRDEYMKVMEITYVKRAGKDKSE